MLGFGSKKSTTGTEKVRADQVQRLVKAEQDEEDASMCLFPGAPQVLETRFRQAEATSEAVRRNSSRAEIEAAWRCQ